MNTIALFAGGGVTLWAIVEMVLFLYMQRGKSESEVKRLQAAFISSTLMGFIGLCMAITMLSYARQGTQYEILPTLIEITAQPRETITPP